MPERNLIIAARQSLIASHTCGRLCYRAYRAYLSRFVLLFAPDRAELVSELFVRGFASADCTGRGWNSKKPDKHVCERTIWTGSWDIETYRMLPFSYTGHNKKTTSSATKHRI